MGGCRGLPGRGSYPWLGAGEELLDRALVAGLLLDATLGGAVLPADSQGRGAVLKTRVQEALLEHLAGRITLDRFRALILTLERAFPFYLPLISTLLFQPGENPVLPSPPTNIGEGGPADLAVRLDVLAASLNGLQDLLPQRPGSKLTREKWLDFLGGTRGRCFRLGDLEDFFKVDRKTAWEYVQKFLAAGLLLHNSGRAAAVRYSLADPFLRVKGEAVRQHAALALEGLPPRLAPLVADRLIAGGGEPFWEKEWGRGLPGMDAGEILARLTAPGSLLTVVAAGDYQNRLLRLRPCYISKPNAV